MTRIVQPEGRRGSLKWIQRAVEERWLELEEPVLARLPRANAIEWRSPLRSDNFAEYRDGAFLKLLELDELTAPLSEFWPRRGPQWDALGRTDAGDVLLVEAKAHIREFCSPGTSAAPQSRAEIENRLGQVAQALGAEAGRPWADMFYQLANRLAHLWFLRQHGIPAFLILVGFVGDEDMGGPAAAETWEAAYNLANYALGLSARHELSAFVIQVHPAVRS